MADIFFVAGSSCLRNHHLCIFGSCSHKADTGSGLDENSDHFCGLSLSLWHLRGTEDSPDGPWSLTWRLCQGAGCLRQRKCLLLLEDAASCWVWIWPSSISPWRLMLQHCLGQHLLSAPWSRLHSESLRQSGLCPGLLQAVARGLPPLRQWTSW